MKKWIICAALMISAAAFGEGWSVEVGTNSVVVAPAIGNPYRQADGSYSNYYVLTDWAAGSIAAGAYVKYEKVTYWTPNGGTATNAPTHLSGVVTTDGITYVALRKGDVRKSLIVSIDDSADEVYIMSEADAGTGGIKLSAILPGVEFGTYEGYIEAKASSGTVTVNVHQNY